MLRTWLSNQLKAREAARQDADALVRDHGDAAYGLARSRSREAREGLTIDPDRDERHWDRVRRRVARRLKLSRPDTATRMLDEST